MIPLNRKIPKIFAIQGCSCSGKSTFASFLERSLCKYLKVIKISTDNFNDTTSLINSEEKLIDFDNPARINWEKLKDVLMAYYRGEEFINSSEYNFITQRRKDIEIKNIYPDVIIVEGIYAFNLFNKKVFDCEKLDPFLKPDEHKMDDDFYYKENTFKIKADVFKIEFRLKKEKMREIRLKRDSLSRANKEYLKDLSERLDQMVLPAAKKWIYTKYNEPDVITKGGTFNEKECLILGEKIVKDLTGISFRNKQILCENPINISDVDLSSKGD